MQNPCNVQIEVEGISIWREDDDIFGGKCRLYSRVDSTSRYFLHFVSCDGRPELLEVVSTYYSRVVSTTTRFSLQVILSITEYHPVISSSMQLHLLWVVSSNS